MGSAPRVSVIVPVHRGAEALKISLRSILGQSEGDLEVIVAGDGADASVEKAAASTGDPRVRWEGFPKAPGFGYSNRSRAIRMTRAPVIAYLAPDDLWGPRHLERLLETRKRDRLDLVFSRPVLVWADGRPRPHYFPFEAARAGFARTRILLLCVSPSHALHTREIHDQAGGWRDDVPRHGDVDFWLRCRLAGARVGFLPEATAVRLPSYAFASGPEDRHTGIQARLLERIFSGELALEDLRWPWPRRIVGWIEDFWVAGPARTPGLARALLLRGRNARVVRNGAVRTRTDI